MEVDFGDSELFEQFESDTPLAKHIRFTNDDDEEEEEEAAPDLRERIEEHEETITRLKTENEELKRKLKFLSRPAGISVVNSKVDGPLCQILFGNNSISKQCRQDIEDYVVGLIQQHQFQQNNGQQASALHPQPQNSSFVMEENQETNAEASVGKHIRDAFCVVGSVLYFTSFCLDKLGQPLLNENPQLTEGWDVPKYQQVFGQVIALEGQEVQIKEKRPKSCCFNCGAEDHQLRDCPKPKDMARINEKRKEFAQVNQGNISSNQRYHAEEVEERFAKYKPGVVSKELLDALGIVANTLPPFIYRMRELGYPPGWLKEAEMENSGLTLYDGKTSGEEDSNGPNQNVCYDVSKLVDFPGFNVSAPPNVRDDYRSFRSIPMQSQHWKPTFAAQLSNMYPAPDSKCTKRCHDPESTPQQTKKRRSNSDFCGSSDMDTDSDHDTPRRDRYDDFQFQPPLPPGSPLISTPPPLPLGTPPVTPTPPPLPKGTPPPTPPTNAGSPVLSGRNGAGCEESEDGLTLEELEEQQRLLWAALESADNGNSDSDTGATATPAMGSPRESPLAEPDARSEEGVEESGSKAEEISDQDRELSSTPASPVEVPISSAEEDKSSNGQVNDSFNEDTGAESYDELIVLDEITQSNDSDPEKNRISEVPEDKTSTLDAQAAEENEEPVVKKVTGVPHRSKFAEGIIPFEDTPEFTEVAEATGVYLRIRGLLKESPRNQAKNKKLNS
ncbi:zinc finger CCHC domain-containing protein 8 [Hemibagrus wyckioides]|uniref:zinc finger CCHC domain-containing protein 8 n=1 Tax=Hemibagrus wyckioides TaxID=337641 RepID=UPI00266D4E39|nr:zinc finger CCHC domain-containing protein 8 [Hemibagrus wyckioides]